MLGAKFLTDTLESKKTGKAAFELGRSIILRLCGLLFEMKILP